ncbi:hypothetical protein SLE2022_250480 [Rubroshorea leprosula]
MENSVPLHTCHVHNFNLLFNRSHALLHSTAIAFLIYYRTSFLFLETKTRPPIIPWLLLFASELLLIFSWLLNLSYRWRPVSRKVFPERLPGDDELPTIDVFICTADPEKEPTLGVMNTVLSSMALDYPPEKLHVYLSDDGGSPLTLKGMREAWSFARWWLPFCQKYGVKTVCPQAYFMGTDEDDDHGSFEFAEERKNIKEKYELMKEAIMQAKEDSKMLSGPSCHCPRDHPPLIEVIEDNPTYLCTSVDIAKSAGQEAAETITQVSDSVIPAFKSAAQELLKNSGLSAEDLLAKALAKAAGFTEIKSRSLLTSMEDHVTLLLEAGKPIYTPSFAYGVLRRFLPEEKVESVKGLTLTADGNGAVFDVAVEDLDTFLSGNFLLIAITCLYI